jgi:two-component system, chemotaxis family, protein-glutamate methylesterase/glutaminase
MAFELIVIGGSLGGMRALETVLEGLPKEFPMAVAVVLHRSADPPADRLRLILQRHARLKVEEPMDKDVILPGCIYVAPPDYHLLVEAGSLALSTEGVVSHARPSIDVLFETAAEAYGPGVIGIVLTGANSDGARGAARIKARGGYLIVQDPETAESPVLPRAAIAAAPADRIVTVTEISPILLSMITKQTDGTHGSLRTRQHSAGR